MGEFHPLGINLPPNHVLECRERPANPYRVSWRSVQETKKSRKSTLGLNISPPSQTIPFTSTFRFVSVGWGHRHNHPCEVSSQSVQQFRLPRGSKFTISHRLGERLLQQCYALTCYTVKGCFLFTPMQNDSLLQPIEKCFWGQKREDLTPGANRPQRNTPTTETCFWMH